MRRQPERPALRQILIVASMVILAHGFPRAAWAITATEELRGYTNQVVRVLQDSTLSSAARRAAVRDIADEAFDLNETARRVLGQHWQERSRAEREDFVRVFHDFLERTYLPWIDDYRGEKIRYVSEHLDGERATVHAMIMTRFGIEVPIESRCLRTGDRWHIYDVLVEHVSLVAYYRSQFDRVIRTGSYAELVNRLKARIERAVETGARESAGSARR